MIELVVVIVVVVVVVVVAEVVVVVAVAAHPGRRRIHEAPHRTARHRPEKTPAAPRNRGHVERKGRPKRGRGAAKKGGSTMGLLDRRRRPREHPPKGRRAPRTRQRPETNEPQPPAPMQLLMEWK